MSATPRGEDRVPASGRLIPSTDYEALKWRLHGQLVARLDLDQIKAQAPAGWRAELKPALEELLRQEPMALDWGDREALVEEILDEVCGLGPLEPLLKDPTISDILVNGPTAIYIERAGKLEETAIQFRDEDHLRRIIDTILSGVGRRVDESSPMVDARLSDGSRVHAIIPPLALNGPCLSIRRFGPAARTADDLLHNETLAPAMLTVLAGAVQARLNILISGGAGAGKTTLLNALSHYIPSGERIITIEDAAELRLQQKHVVRLETRPANLEGRGAVRQRQLVTNALRMRPDRIIVGEVRGEEAVDMMQAMNTGHEGSLATIHANSARDALARLETMIAMANLNLPDRTLRRQIASAIQVVVQMARLPDGTRRLVDLAEITGMEGDMISMQSIFTYEKRGVNSRGQVLGTWRTTGIRPRFAERLSQGGIRLPRNLFEENDTEPMPSF